MTADEALLRARLASAPVPFVEGALSNPALGEENVVQMLRNNALTPDILSRIARNRSLTASYKVKKGLVSHHRTPLAVSRVMLNHLFWKDLRLVAENLRLNPVLRRSAEDLLIVRLAELSLGEMISLARNATRGLIKPLICTGEDRVLEALLGNPRFREGDVALIADDADTPAEILDRIARHPVWGIRPEVRNALLRNPRTPVHAAMRMLRRMPQRDLRNIERDDKIPKIVRVGAERHLVRVRPSGPPPDS